MDTGGPALYGDYIRPEFGLIRKPAIRNRSDVWFILFPEPGSWKSAVEVAYAGHKRFLGHAYTYEANREGQLRLVTEKHLSGLRGGFTCGNGQALYAWRRSPDYTVLRLEAIRDLCTERRKILETDWSFVD